MTKRTWLYNQMAEFPGLAALIGEDNPRIFAKKSMTSSIELHPFIVYKLGYNASEELSETKEVDRQFVQIFVHDFSDGDTADYMRIDEVIIQLRKALLLGSSPEDGVIAIKYLETSQDFNDETLNTVMKYVRFQMITEEI